MTALGDRRSAGATEIAGAEVVDATVYHRLDLGPFYPLDGPPDRRLRDAAWLAAGIARRIRPSLVHGFVAGDSLDSALIGIALGRHLHVPVVLEAVGDLPVPKGADAARFQAAAVAALQLADQVVAPDQKAKDALVAVGVDARAIAVVRTGGRSAKPGANVAGVYADVLARAGGRGLA
jgi:glycosyl transferase family 4